MNTTTLDLAYENLKVKEIKHTLDTVEIITENNLRTSEFFDYITEMSIPVESLVGNKLIMSRNTFYTKINSQLKEFRVKFLDFKYNLEVEDISDDMVKFSFEDDGENNRDYSVHKKRIIGSRLLASGDLSILDTQSGYNVILKKDTDAFKAVDLLIDDSKMIAYLRDELSAKNSQIKLLEQEIGELVLKNHDLEETPEIVESDEKVEKLKEVVTILLDVI